MLPWELLQEEGILYVGAYGIRNTEEEVEKRMTTNAVVVRIVASLSSEAEPNAAPSPDLWEQYRMEILGYQSDAEDSAAQAAASASQAAGSASQASASAMQADSSPSADGASGGKCRAGRGDRVGIREQGVRIRQSRIAV